MQDEKDWGKRAVIAAWILGILMLILAVLSYFRPPDPSHPMSLDFLSKSIAIPSWLAAILAIGLPAIAVLLMRWRLKYAPIEPMALALVRHEKVDVEDNLLEETRAHGITRAYKEEYAAKLRSTEQTRVRLETTNQKLGGWA